MRIPLIAVAFVLAGSTPAFAHRLHVEAKVAGDQLRVEAYYSDDTPAQEARITITRGDQPVAEGRTDERGVWTCPRPAPGTYTVRAESAGHAARETLVVPQPDPVPTTEPTPTINERSE